MLNTKNAQIEALIKVAHALGDLNNQVVYVGGAVVSLEPATQTERHAMLKEKLQAFIGSE